jgi:hypothetical protein
MAKYKPPKDDEPKYACLRCHTRYFTLDDALKCSCPPSGHPH